METNKLGTEKDIYSEPGPCMRICDSVPLSKPWIVFDDTLILIVFVFASG